MKAKLKKIVQFLCNPKLLICLGIAWIITNGWAYILFGIGTYFHIKWMMTVSTSYLAFLWFPFTPEKILTVIIAIALLKILFPRDEKTLKILVDLYHKIRGKFRRKTKDKS